MVSLLREILPFPVSSIDGSFIRFNFNTLESFTEACKKFSLDKQNRAQIFTYSDDPDSEDESQEVANSHFSMIFSTDDDEEKVHVMVSPKCNILLPLQGEIHFRDINHLSEIKYTLLQTVLSPPWIYLKRRDEESNRAYTLRKLVSFLDIDSPLRNCPLYGKHKYAVAFNGFLSLMRLIVAGVEEKGNWYTFLFEGLYDPRLFILITSFML